MKIFRRLFFALIAVGLAAAALGAAREQGWPAVMRALVDALPIAGVVALLIGFLALMNRREARMHRRFYRHGSHAEGTVVSVGRAGRGGAAYVVAAEFSVDGRICRAVSGRLPEKPARGVGERVTVYYNPERPEDNCILDGDLM